MVNQISVVGILMIVNGSLCSVLGLLLGIMGPAMFSMMADAPMPADGRQIITIVSVIYIILGVLLLTAGVMNIVGGIQAMKFRSRGLVLTALFFNILPIFTFYCTLTSLGLLIYGAIVMFNAEVVSAFGMAQSGMSPDEIRYRLDPYGRRVRYEEEQRRRDDDRWEAETRPPPPPPSGASDDTRYYGDK